MRRLLRILPLFALVIALLTVPAPAQSAPPSFDHLDPGGQPTLREVVPVNVVLLGYRRDQVDRRALRAGLADRYEPVVQSRLWYDQVEKLGITYDYDYRISFAQRRYENRFFAQLKRLSKRAALTEFQTAYNAQQRNRLDVTANYEISAVAVERWLAKNPPPGVNPRQNTVVLINWFNRPDFRFHVYTKTDEPDPDTGYNFGAELDNRKVVAWGGTTAADEESGLGRTRRIWFHDISAGPEAWAGSWNVDDADLDGDEVADYRIPTVWEYGRYRPRAALSGDLAKLVRYVALDLLFTSSPIYPVELPTPEQPYRINVDSNTYEGWPGVNASRTYIKPRLLLSELREVMPEKRLDYDNQDLPFTGRAKTCYDLVFVDQTCFPGSGYPSFANFYLQNTADLARTKDDGDSVDYELPIFNYAVDDEPVPALGFADDNWVDGTQSYVFNFISPDIVQSGYGLTTTMIHEVGHHVGLAHPHDGYDSESGVSFGPSGDYFFAWAGDESNSMMSYIDLNWDFSQFDRDNLDRFKSAAGIEGANRLAAAALAAEHPERAGAALRAADRAVGRAERAFAQHRYAESLAWSTLAYRLAWRGARAAGVDPAAATADARRSAPAGDRDRPEPLTNPADEAPGPRG